MHVLSLASHLKQFRPAILCVNADRAYAERLQLAGLAYTNLGAARFEAWRAPAVIRQLVRVVGQARPEVVHSYGFSADLLAALVRLILPKCRIITSRRGADTNRRHQKLRSLINTIANQVICVSEETAAFASRTERLRTDKVQVIPNGVGLAEFPTVRSDARRLRFGTLGNVKPVKGTDLLVDAFCRFSPDIDAELHIGGSLGVRDRDKSWSEDVVRRAAQSPHRDNIVFAGFQAEPREFLRSLDVFVLPSRSEGMSNALLEAMSLGLPSIATDVGSNATVLTPIDADLPGIVCQASVESLFASMQRMLACNELRARCGAAARRVVASRYSLSAMVDQYEKTYMRLIAAGEH